MLVSAAELVRAGKNLKLGRRKRVILLFCVIAHQTRPGLSVFVHTGEHTHSQRLEDTHMHTDIHKPKTETLVILLIEKTKQEILLCTCEKP